MEDRRGLSDVVTTVIIVALSLVAITVVWVVVQQLITSNTDSVQNQQLCLDSSFEVTATKSNDNSAAVVVKRLQGSDKVAGFLVYGYNSTTSVSKVRGGDLVVGAIFAESINVNKIEKVSVIPYFKTGSQNFTCNGIEYNL